MGYTDKRPPNDGRAKKNLNSGGVGREHRLHLGSEEGVHGVGPSLGHM